MTYLKDVQISRPLTAFGELQTAQNLPVIQAHSAYDILPANFTTFTGTGGTATVTGGMFTCTTGTLSGGYGVIRTIRSLIYRAGQGAHVHMTAKFTTGVANSGQIAGAFNIGDGFFFGYNGTSFGVCHRYGGLAESRVITVTGASAGSTNLTLTLNTVAYTIPLTAGTTAHNAYEIATWLEANQTVWNASQNGSDVVIIATTDGAKSGTYTYSHATSTGTFATTMTGVTKTETWTAQASWNQSTASWLDPTKGNVYRINYQYLGFGDIYFWVENPTTGLDELVHIIRYTNANTTPSIRNPSLRLGISAYSLGSTTNLTVACASIEGAMQGIQTFIRNPRAINNTKSLNTTTSTNILTIRNREVFGGYYNQGEIQLLQLSLGNASTKIIVFEVWANPTVAGEPNYAYLGSNNISEYDTAGTTVSGGTPILHYVVAPSTSMTINLFDFRIRLPPANYFTISAKQSSAGGAASDWTASVVLYEDVF